MKLENIRKEIDKIDNELLALLIKRFEISKKIGLEKKKIGEKIEDKERETKLLNKLIKENKDINIDKRILLRIWKLIMQQSKKLQKTYD